MDEIKVCAYCGTEYPATRQTCPLCGMNEAEAQKAREEADFGTAAPPAVGHSAPVPKGGRKKGGARVAKKQRGADRIPTWMTVLICIILAIALFIGIVFAVTSIRSMVSVKTPNLPAGDDVVSLPGATDDLNGQGTAPDQNPDTPLDPDQDPDASDNIEPNNAGTGDTSNPADSTDVLCTSLGINYSDVTLKEAGESFTITPRVLPENCTEEVVWTSSDASICAVEDGKVVAIDGGTATITATCGEKTASCIVRCDFAHTGNGAASTSGSYSLSSTDFTLFSAGETATLTVSGASGQGVTWSTSNASVATIDGSGTVKAVGPGTATVTASVGGKTLSCIVRCSFTASNANTPPADTTESTGTSGSYSLSSTDVTISPGESFTLSVTDSSGAAVSSANYGTSNAAVCTANGSSITGVASGTATVTVSVGGQQLSCIVRVK